MLRLKVPTAALDAAFKLNVLLPLPGEAMLPGAKLAVTPCGIPLTDSTAPALNPFSAAVVTAMGMLTPRARITFVPPGVSVK